MFSGHEHRCTDFSEILDVVREVLAESFNQHSLVSKAFNVNTAALQIVESEAIEITLGNGKPEIKAAVIIGQTLQKHFKDAGCHVRPRALARAVADLTESSCVRICAK